ncbi:MAG: DUF930 domain-containing protein [Rhizobium rhizophilum]|uniref:DUF930 domain-containing protein n=1 Tax=Rhizobium rhizophilum TaxID=1850373 RepID=UPI00391D9C2C
MTDTRKTGWRRLGGGFAVSLLLHGLAVAVFLLSFDNPVELSETEQAIEVTLVAPPEEPEPESVPVPEEAEEAQEEPAEPEAPEPPPEPEPEPAPEPEPQPEPPAPAPQPEPAEQPPVPEPELPDAATAPIPVLRPVVRFGERDSGPELSRGTEAEPDAAEDAQAEEQAEEVADAAPTLAQPEIALPEAPPMEGALAEAAEETLEGAGEEEASAEDQPSDAAVVTAVAEAALQPREVTELFSSAISGDQAAMTAMAGLTRQERGDQLCGTELSQQLRNGSPSYVPYLLPILRLKEGNVVDVPLAAFRDINGAWINIGVRCEVDDDATEVVRFSLSIGKTVPRAEWAERGFPDS